MKAPIVPLAALVLSACGTMTQAPSRVEVPVPVIQPCVLESDIPARPEPVAMPGANIERLAAGISVDLRQADIYTQQLLALLRGCAEPAK